MAFAQRFGTMARRGISSYVRRAAAMVPWAGDRHCPSMESSGCAGYKELDGLFSLRSYYSTHAASIHGPLGPDGLPLEVDWRKHGVVTDVVHQGRCGCCWACASTAGIEGINALETNKLIKLSMQQLVDAVDWSTDGCNGGSPLAAYQYVIDNGGLVPDAVYPFEERRYPAMPIEGMGVTISNYGYCFNCPEQKLKELVARQPIVAAVGADKSFQAYTDEVLDGTNYPLKEMMRLKIAHLVTIIGYGISPLGLYWLIKNSWGKKWGLLNGYAMLARDTVKVGGALGIARFLSWPLKGCPNSSRILVKSELDMKLHDRFIY